METLNFSNNAINDWFEIVIINKDNIKLSEKLMEYTDKVFYKNGIYEKLYYDSKLRNSKIYKVNENKFNIEYRDLHLKKPDSIFYFSEELNFVGSFLLQIKASPLKGGGEGGSSWLLSWSCSKTTK